MLGFKDGLIYTNQLVQYTALIKGNIHMIVSLDAEEAFENVKYIFMIKTLKN